MLKDYFKFKAGKIESFISSTSYGVIKEDHQSERIYFFLSDFNRISTSSPVGMKVFFSQVETKSDNQKWSMVVVENTQTKLLE